MLSKLRSLQHPARLRVGAHPCNGGPLTRVNMILLRDTLRTAVSFKNPYSMHICRPRSECRKRGYPTSPPEVGMIMSHTRAGGDGGQEWERWRHRCIRATTMAAAEGLAQTASTQATHLLKATTPNRDRCLQKKLALHPVRIRNTFFKWAACSNKARNFLLCALMQYCNI